MPLKSRLLLFAWFFYFCSLPLFKSFANVAEVALLILTFLPGTLTGFSQTLSRNKPVAALALIFVVLALGILHTEDIKNGWRELKHAHRFVIVPFLFLAHARLLQEHFRKLLLSYIMATCAACAFIIFLFYGLPENTVRDLANNTKLMLPYPDSTNRASFGLYSPFIDRLQFSSLTAVAILTCIFLWVKNNNRKLLLAASPLLVFTLLIMGGRGAQAALFVSLLVYALALGFSVFMPALRNHRYKAAITAIMVAGGIFVFAGIPYLSYRLLQPVQDRINQTRWEINLLQNDQYRQYDYQHFTTLRRLVSYRNMWAVVQQNPIIGVGTGDYQQEIKKVYNQNNPDMVVNTHNQYLLYWAMTGIVGLAVFVGVIGYWLLSLQKSGQLYYYGLAFLIFYLVVMFSDPVLGTQVDNMTFCSFFALIGLLRHTAAASASSERAPEYA